MHNLSSLLYQQRRAGRKGSWLVARGSWLVARGSWLVARGSWLVARGSWLVARGSWLVARARGSWRAAFISIACMRYRRGRPEQGVPL
ncbi:hypothetical protein I3300191I4_03310 [Megasphaera elsdenii]